MPLSVTPGSLVDSFVNFAYNYEGFHFDLGYNLFWKEKESVKIKDIWANDGLYRVAQVNLASLPIANSNDGQVVGGYSHK